MGGGGQQDPKRIRFRNSHRPASIRRGKQRKKIRLNSRRQLHFDAWQNGLEAIPRCSTLWCVGSSVRESCVDVREAEAGILRLRRLSNCPLHR